ncbi:MAG: O-antigen ligase family protein [Salinivirgaceae bacterium]|nr:O-antigen ligase family protein [Salinivirgaceae bacterium]
MTKKSSALVFIIILLTTGQVFQFFTRFTGIPTFWPSVLAIVIFTIFYNPTALFKNTVLYTLLLYGILLFLNANNRLNNIPDVELQPFGILSMVFPYVVVAIVLENLLVFSQKNENTVQTIGKYTFYIILLSLVISIVSEINFPGLTRGYGKHPVLPSWAWTLSFGTVYSIPFVFMIIVSFYKSSTRNLIIVLTIIVINALVSGFLTALALTVICGIVGLVFRFKVKRRIFIFTSIFFFISLLYSFRDVFIEILPSLPHAVYQEKANDLSMLEKSDNTTDFIAETRQGVYNHSIKTIKKYPFFGSGDYDAIGQHSYWLDKMGFYGILITFLYFLILFTLFKKARSLLIKEEVEQYNFLFIIMLVFLFLNPIEWPDFWLNIFVVIPSMIVYFRKSNEPMLTKGDENLQ